MKGEQTVVNIRRSCFFSFAYSDAYVLVSIGMWVMPDLSAVAISMVGELVFDCIIGVVVIGVCGGALRAIYPDGVVEDVDVERGVQRYIGFSNVINPNWVVGDGFPREKKET